jgi:hypothetical protein
MRRYIPLVAVLLGFLLLGQGIKQISHVSALAGTPSLNYLGEGGSHTIEAGRHFIVKRTGPFVFVTVPGPTYDAAPDERVWAASVGAPAARVRTWIDYGTVPENCKISYTAIDDDPDDRINVFYVGDDAVHDMPQGFVTGGSFNTPKGGNLRLYAEDSIGVWVDKCESVEPTETPTVTPQPPTETPEPTVTVTPGGPTSTPGVPEPTSTSIPPTATTPPTATATATKKPRLPACFRINFEMGGDEAREGIYEVREVGGRLLYTWYAQEGWRDSGWVYGIDISFEDVYIEVFYVPDDGPRINMDIVNPSPGTPYGWLTRGKCHALEVAWPDENITPTPTPDAYDGYNDEFDLEELSLQKYIWPDVQPLPTSTPASSLNG